MDVTGGLHVPELPAAGEGRRAVIWDEALLAYDFGPGHPMNPRRLALTMDLVRELGVLPTPGVDILCPPLATEDELAMVHEREYIAALRAVRSSDASEPSRGIGTADNPAFERMHEAAARIAGGSLLLARELLAGRICAGINIAGGLHHAGAGAASGFCLYNDAALAIQRLLDGGARRVAYIDMDAHHGDGVQNIFAHEPRVLTISVHESGQTLFPGSGACDEVGASNGGGTAANVALPAGTGSAGWLRAFDAVVPALLRAFEPDVLVSQHGCDSHRRDDLTHLQTSIEAQRQVALAVQALAYRYTGGRWIALGGGGYEIVAVVPLVWAHVVAIVTGVPLSPQERVPLQWRERVAGVGVAVPERMGDGEPVVWRPWSKGYDPADPVDRAVLATRRAIFPAHGLDPWRD